MAKRKQVARNIHSDLFKMAFVAGSLWVVVSIISKAWLAIFWGVGVFAVLAVLLEWVAKAARRANVTNAVNRAWTQHQRALITQRAKLVQRDIYGHEDHLKWEREIARFVTNHVVPMLSQDSRHHLQSYVDEIFIDIDNRVLRASVRNSALSSFSPDMGPNAFEHYCAEELRRAGWTARVTQASADQGVDVIAERNGRLLVLQCKLYSRPVGNKAVQEIAAGRAHERADLAAVCSNQPYTPAAKRLAGTNQVLLIHPTELNSLHERFNITYEVLKGQENFF